jgi:hypothetical protein
MRKVSDLKGRGYLISAVSVVLLAIPACKSASEEPLMLAALLTGAAFSIIGMALRWRSHRIDQKEKDALRRPG